MISFFVARGNLVSLGDVARLDHLASQSRTVAEWKEFEARHPVTRPARRAVRDAQAKP